MKFTKSKWLGSLVIAGELAMFTTRVRAQVQAGNIGSFTNIPTVITATNTITATTNILILQQNTGLALEGTFATAASAAAASGAWIWFSVDGTNYPAAPIIITCANNGGTYVTWWTNWSAAQLAGLTSMKVQLTNANANNLTNAGINWNKWNPPTSRPF